MNQNDTALLDALRSDRSPQALAEIVRRYQDLVYAACYRILGDAALAEDAAQATFLVLWQKAGRLGAQVSLAGWLYRTAGWTSMNAKKMQRRRQEHEQRAARMIPEERRIEGASWEDIRPCLDRALAALPSTQRESVVLRYLQGLPPDEVAETMGRSPAVVRVWLSRGLKTLQRKLQREGIAISGAMLATWLGSEANATAPAGFAAAVEAACAGGTLAKGAAAVQIADWTARTMFWSQAKGAAAIGVGAILAAALAITGGYGLARGGFAGGSDAGTVAFRAYPADVLDVWGGGQLMAFSGLDGPTPFDRALVCRTSFAGTGLSVMFPDAAELIFSESTPRRAFVTGDVFDLAHPGGRTRGAFLDACHLLVEGPCRIRSAGKKLTVVTSGPRTLIAPADRCDPRRVDAELDRAIAERLQWLRAAQLPPIASDLRRKTFVKCLSVMKSAVYSPEGKLRHRYTTPDRWPHRGMWLLDSALHAIGIRHADPSLARDAIEAVLDAQHPDGLVQISYFHRGGRADLVQPPLLAAAAELAERVRPDPDFVARIYPKLAACLEWDMKNRDADGDGLLEWRLDGDPAARSGESDWDNSPRFDLAKPINAVDFNAYLARECEVMAAFARRLGKADEEARWADHHRRLCRLINDKLWSESSGIYVDALAHGGAQQPLLTAAGFLPLFCGAPTPERARRLAAHLRDPKTFATALPVATVSPSHRDQYTKDLSRGPAWVNVNWCIAKGFERYGLIEEARLIRDRTLAAIETYYQRHGALFEFYDADDLVPPPQLPRKGRNEPGSAKHQAIHDILRTAALYVDWCAAADGADARE
jgi:putative isomerase